MADIDSASPTPGEVFDLTLADRRQLASDIRQWADRRGPLEDPGDGAAGGMSAETFDSWTQLADTVERSSVFDAEATTRIEMVLRATYLDWIGRPPVQARGGLGRWVKSLEKPVALTTEDNDRFEEALSEAERRTSYAEQLDFGVPEQALDSRRRATALRDERDRIAVKYGFEDAFALDLHADLYGRTVAGATAPGVRQAPVLPGVDGPFPKEHTMTDTENQIPQPRRVDPALLRTGRFDQLTLTDDERSRLGRDIHAFATTAPGLTPAEGRVYAHLSEWVGAGGLLAEEDGPKIDRVLDYVYGKGAVHEDLARFAQVSNHFHETLFEHSAQHSLLHLSREEAGELAQVVRDYADSPTAELNPELRKNLLVMSARATVPGRLLPRDDGLIEAALKYEYGNSRVVPATLSKVARMAGTHYHVAGTDEPPVRRPPVLPGVDDSSTKEPIMAEAENTVTQDSWASSPAPQGARYGRPTRTENIPVSGFIASDPKYTPAAGEKKSFIRARLGLHSFSKGADGETVDDPTFVDLAAFGRLADKMYGALKKGDDVTGVATQEISTRTLPDGNSELRVRYVADRLGPDLMSGKAQVSLDRNREHRVDQQVSPATVAAAQSKSSSIHM